MKVVFRTDAGLRIGSGHVMRCLTLAEVLRAQGADTLFICREHEGHLGALIAARGHALRLLPREETDADGHAAWLGASWEQDAQETAAALGERADWLVVDQYALDARWERAMRAHTARIMVIDDLADRAHDCDLLLDQNFAEAMDERYRGLLAAHTETLLGPHFALLRPEFSAARAALCRRDGQVRRLLVFIGGGDPDDYTGRVLEQAARHPQLDIDVVVGAAYPHYGALAARCAQLAQLAQVRLHRGVDNMAELMAASDLAIGAGGGATWERACVGLPSLVMAVADNQRPACAALGRHGHVLYLGETDAALRALPAALQLALSAPEWLAHLQASSLALVDGRGAERVARRLRQLGAAERLLLRPATAEDCDAIWSWRNADAVRRFSVSSEPIALERHRGWYAAVLADPARQLLIGEIGGRAAGVLRYDRTEAKATVSVYLTPDFIGQGVGSSLIRAGSDWVRAHWPAMDVIEAVVLPGNQASARAFETAGYIPQLNTLALRIHD